ncbi:MAG TPA: AIR synthase family protein [bacterium]
MRAGKVSAELLQRLVYPHLGHRPDVLVHAHLGLDCAAIDFGEWTAVLTTDPITGAGRHLGRYAVHVACNDLATTGAEPVALLLTLLLQEGSAPDDVEVIMREAGAAAAGLKVEIVGGHTEVTPGIDHNIAVMTALGRARKGTLISAAGGRPGDAVLLTKTAGLEGTAILAIDLDEDLRTRLDGAVVERARAFLDRISVVPEGMAAARAGASAMHDVTEGGVLGGAWELAEASGIGIELRAEAIPIAPETQAICAVLRLDPLRLISSGAMLIAAPDSAAVLGALADARIPAAVIGTMTAQSRLLRRGGQVEALQPPERDELWRALAARPAVS